MLCFGMIFRDFYIKYLVNTNTLVVIYNMNNYYPVVQPVRPVPLVQLVPLTPTARSPSILSSRPAIKPPPYTSFTPVSPRRSTVPSSNVSHNEHVSKASIQSYIPVPRFPEVPIIVLKQTSDNSSHKNNLNSSSKQTQGLLSPYIPAPYEQGPDGLSLIIPRKVNSSISTVLSSTNRNNKSSRTTNGILSVK